MRWNNLKTLYWIIFAMVFSSCGDNNDPVSEQFEEPTVFFQITINTLSNDNTRSDGVGNREETLSKVIKEVGNQFENSIDVNSLQMFVYQSDNTYVGQVEDLHHVTTIGGGTSPLYRFEGRMLKEKFTVDGTYKFMVIANSKSPFNPATPTLTYSLSDVTSGIPMWGVAELTLAKGAYGVLSDKYDLGKVNLLRAVAKAEVSLDPSLTSHSLKDVKINYYNQSGSVLPKNWNSVSETVLLADDEAASFNPIDNSLSNFSFSPSGGVAANAKSFIGYLPEYTNKSGAKEAVISVTLVNGSNSETVYADRIKFRDYLNGAIDPTSPIYNLVRNNYYKFIIKSVGTDLSLTCEVLPWTLNQEEWDYSDQVSIQESGKLKWTNYAQIDETQAVVVFKKNHNLKASFKIDTPKGAQWYASFIPMEGDIDAFRFVENGKKVKVASGKLGEPASLEITTLNKLTDRNNKAHLRVIIRTLDGRTIHVKNLVDTTGKEYTIVQPMNI